jgi:Raf kinase inhibitor-like YbhB/YbcL family protein
MTMILQPASLSITSPAFTNEGAIPEKYTCQGSNVSPPLNIDNIPQGVQTLVLIMDDPDAPDRTFDHWVLFNIEPVSTINENRSPGTLGKNGAGKSAYIGPCPPAGTHRYFFKLYALDSKLQLKEGATKQQVEDAMKGHVVASAQLMGTYQKRS